jgi:type IV secretory pathway ATPase VirB11/archaellum biosynthesis ATPase
MNMEEDNTRDQIPDELSLDKLLEVTPIKDNSQNAVIAPQPQSIPELPKRKLTALEWFAEMHWSRNPFTFTIIPELFVGYQDQLDRVLMALEERHKFVYLAGPTGSGKTTLLKWLLSRIPREFDVLYVAKPPERPEYFKDIFNRSIQAKDFCSGSLR